MAIHTIVDAPHRCRGTRAPHTARGLYSWRSERGEISMRVVVAIVILVFSLGTWGCGSSDSGGSPVTPTPSQTPAPTSTSVVTINVIGINGAQSFSPNPATLPSGQMVVWHTIDSVTHRVVFNDGSLDTGTLDPGASSQTMTI